MPRVTKTEKEAFNKFLTFLEGSANIAKTTPWIWLDGMSTQRVYNHYLECGGTRHLKGFTTVLLNTIGRDYIGLESKRENGLVTKHYYCKKVN